MPYITQGRRNALVGRVKEDDIQDRVDAPIDEYHELVVLPEQIGNVGELNYVLTTIANDYFQRNGMNYRAVNDVVGALRCAEAEFYRRVAAPYEDKKIEANGDVY